VTEDFRAGYALGVAVRELCQSSAGFADSSFRKGALEGCGAGGLPRKVTEFLKGYIGLKMW